uniref:HEPN domain-containing protein n=1 Tax=Ignisphaera aggregans TaxID=334771 RepID=A0A7J2U0Z6_9CREN
MTHEDSFDKPFDDARKRLELAERFLAEGKELIDESPVQASEKLYKAAEEAVKVLAIALKLPEADEAKRCGWSTDLLEGAVISVMKRLGVEELYHWWDSAYKLHVDGFCEGFGFHRAWYCLISSPLPLASQPSRPLSSGSISQGSTHSG